MGSWKLYLLHDGGPRKDQVRFFADWRAIEIDGLRWIDELTKTVSRNSRMKLEEMERHGAWWWVGTERLKFEESRQVAAPTPYDQPGGSSKFDKVLEEQTELPWWWVMCVTFLTHFCWKARVLDPFVCFSCFDLALLSRRRLHFDALFTTQESLQGWRKGSIRFAGPQNGNNRTALKQKNQTSESPDRKLQCEVHYSRIAIYIYSSLVTIFDCATCFSS